MRQKREFTSLRMIGKVGGSAICEMDNGREVRVNFQNIPFEVKLGDCMDATIYYKPGTKEIEEIIVSQKS